MTETFNVNTDKQKMLCTTVIIICNMPLARKLTKKKTLFCAFEPDHYDNKLQNAFQTKMGFSKTSIFR